MSLGTVLFTLQWRTEIPETTSLSSNFLSSDNGDFFKLDV